MINITIFGRDRILNFSTTSTNNLSVLMAKYKTTNASK